MATGEIPASLPLWTYGIVGGGIAHGRLRANKRMFVSQVPCLAQTIGREMD